MGKKGKRSQNMTVYCAVEGEGEAIFLEYLKGIYSNLQTMRFPENPCKGGSPDKIIMFAIRNTHYTRAFAWVDEDKFFQDQCTIDSIAKCWCLNEEQIKSLNDSPLHLFQNKFNPMNRKPSLIVSRPICFEGFILKILGNKLPHEEFDSLNRQQQIQDLKNAVPLELKNNPFVFYTDNLPREKLEEKRADIVELDILIKLISA